MSEYNEHDLCNEDLSKNEEAIFIKNGLFAGFTDEQVFFLWEVIEGLGSREGVR